MVVHAQQHSTLGSCLELSVEREPEAEEGSNPLTFTHCESARHAFARMFSTVRTNKYTSRHAGASHTLRVNTVQGQYATCGPLQK